MGIFKAASAAVRGTLADQWLEAFSCDALRADTLVQRGRKMTSDRSSNTEGSDDVISAGSVILVPDGAAAVVTEMGKVIACYETSGEHKFTGEKARGVFGGGVSSALRDVGSRIAYGGDVPIVQRVYFINTKECPDNPFCLVNVPLRLRDENTGLDLDACVTQFLGDSFVDDTTVEGFGDNPADLETIKVPARRRGIDGDPDGAVRDGRKRAAERTAAVYRNALRAHPKRAARQMGADARDRAVFRGDLVADGRRGGYGHVPHDPARQSADRSRHGGGDARRGAGGRDDGRGAESGGEHARRGASGRADAPETVGLRMRRGQHGQFLRKLRQTAVRGGTAMFYQIGDAVREIPADKLREDVLTAGYVDCETLQALQDKLRFAPATVESR